MGKIIDISVEKDHIESLTKANGINSLSELIWDSLDADATEVKVQYKPKIFGGYKYLRFIDDGHELTHEKAQDVFSRLRGSEKKNGFSKSNRQTISWKRRKRNI
ncbi:ATP-binding protein [Tannerella sp.]|uniref:ATP-binding protein n=1 Tax=Tannerella sp. TaxID=2382127 RepID=UPI003FA1F079